MHSDENSAEIGLEEIKVCIQRYAGDAHRGYTDEMRMRDEMDFERFKKLDEKYVSDPSIIYDND